MRSCPDIDIDPHGLGPSWCPVIPNGTVEILPNVSFASTIVKRVQ